MKYRFVWFDLGLTLVHNNIEELYQQVLAAFGLYRSHGDIGRAVYLANKEFMRRYPHVLGTQPDHFMPWYLGVMNYHLDIRLDLEENYRIYKQALRESNLRWRLIPGALEVLEALKRQNVGIGLISNWDQSCRSVLKENGIDAFVDLAVISSELGIEKPDALIFTAALEAAGAAPDEALYVGDNYYDDVVGAAKADIKSLLIAPYGRLGIEEIEYTPVISGIGEVLAYIE